MGRRVPKHQRKARPLRTAGSTAKRSLRDGVFLVRDVPPERAVKDYICPGCQNPIRQGTSHVVAWPETPVIGHSSGLEMRRHWHRHCWERHS